MNKLAVAAAVLALAGVAAAGAYYVKSSVCNGTCPMTGEPIAARRDATAAAGIGRVDAAAPAAATAFAAHDGSAAGCPMSANRSECSEKAAAECADEIGCEEEVGCDEVGAGDCCKKKTDCGDCEPAKKPTAENP